VTEQVHETASSWNKGGHHPSGLRVKPVTPGQRFVPSTSNKRTFGGDQMQSPTWTLRAAVQPLRPTRANVPPSPPNRDMQMPHRSSQGRSRDFGGPISACTHDGAVFSEKNARAAHDFMSFTPAIASACHRPFNTSASGAKKPLPIGWKNPGWIHARRRRRQEHQGRPAACRSRSLYTRRFVRARWPITLVMSP